jgi:hypothetical protein
MGLVAPVLIGIVLFFWLAFMFTIWAWLQTIIHLCKCQFIRASIWFCTGTAMLVWWDGRYSWDGFLPLYITLVGAGVIASPVLDRFGFSRPSASSPASSVGAVNPRAVPIRRYRCQ